MSYIEVKEYDPGPGNEYIASMYPGNGLYWVERMNGYYVVGNGCASMACFPAVGRILETKDVPGRLEVAASSLDPIAMLAVALHANAAGEYIKKGGA